MAKYVTPLGNQGIYILDTASWRTVRPVMDKNRCVNCGQLPELLPCGQHFRRGADRYSYATTTARAAASAPRSAPSGR